MKAQALFKANDKKRNRTTCIPASEAFAVALIESVPEAEQQNVYDRLKSSVFVDNDKAGSRQRIRGAFKLKK